jgi:hypothetical protein
MNHLLNLDVCCDNMILKQLPFQFKEMPFIKRKVISDFEILNFVEWGARFPDYKINKIDK